MELKGPGFILRGWHIGDATSLQKHADNPNISAFLMDRFPYPYTVEVAEDWINSQQDQQPFVNFALAIEDNVVGGVGFELREDVYRKTALIGYWMSEDHWGKGIMTQAVKLAVNYAFAHLDIIRVQAGVLSKNPASMRVLEKAGFIKEGIMRKAVIKHGEIMDEHLYAILKG
jgi:ribosomal-protein-alanine N-acetyltransferase